MENRTESRTATLWILIVLMFILGVAAIISGLMLFLAPDGHLMRMSVDALKGTPFPDYLIPGIILFLFMGLYPIFVGYSLMKRPTWNGVDIINPFKSFHWAWTASLASGLILLIWIITETLLIGYESFLQPLMAVWGILIIIITLLPNVKRYYKSKA